MGDPGSGMPEGLPGGMLHTMNYGTMITIDAAGRLVVPKSIRDAAGLVPGSPLSITFRDGRIVIEPAPIAVEIVDRGGFTIAEPVAPVDALEHDTVRDVRDGLRTRRKPR
jgi:AbrB family looped-hinge helix DNA binding protein